ncbi:MAG: TonB-dependent receptor, partial [Bdellovibrionales bacterium]|nr:TonB-dependent receptor [Bdellovibrionales bacterium]
EIVRPSEDKGRMDSFVVTALAAEAQWLGNSHNFGGGLRLEGHNRFGLRLVPRVSGGLAAGSWRFKGSAAMAYKNPTIANYRARPNIKPERIQAVEVEASRGLGSSGRLAVSGHVTRISDVIVYGYDDIGNDFYRNAGTSGTTGIELNLSFRPTQSLRWSVSAGGYVAAGGSDVSEYTDGREGLGHLGIPRFKAVARATWSWLGVDWNPLIEHRSAVRGARPGGGTTSYPSVTIASLHLRKTDAFGLAGFDLGAGVRNLLNQDDRFVQPYSTENSDPHMPLPALGREWIVSAGYRVPLSGQEAKD